MTEHALTLARRGWAVFPCKPRDKAPATPHGCKDASFDLAEVEKMFAPRADFNVAVACGSASGLWILDVDSAEALVELQKLGSLPETISASTARGKHFYFRCNGGEPVKNRTKIAGLDLDARGEGGYCIAPPSVHKSGSLYKWEFPPDSTPLATAPEWLTDLVLDRKGLTSDTSLTSGLSFVVGGDLDLANDPGASKGSRHSQATRLIGSAFGRGLDLVEVARQATAWAGRCSPAMDESEVLRLVQDIGKREGTKIEAVQREIEAEPLPEERVWPVLHEDAFYGLAGELVRKIEPESEADPAGLLVQTLVSFGNVVGRAAFFNVEGTSHHANLFGVLVGATARGRKGTSEGRVRQVLRFADEEWQSERILSGLVSGEGLVWNVRDPIYENKPTREKKQIVGYEETLVDPGVDDKRLLVVESEFASVLRVCRRETNTLSPILRSAWDSGHLRTLAKNSPAKATGAHISLIGHITEQELSRSLSEVDSFNGFANRFLWCCVRRSKLLPDGGQDLDLSRFAERFKHAADYASLVERMRRDGGASKLWGQIYARLSQSGSAGLLAAVISRAEAQVLRLSMIYALLDQSMTIQSEHLRAADAVWQYCEDSARRVFGGSTGDALADKVLDLIRQHPDGISRWDLHKAAGKDRKSVALIGVLVRLRDSGLVRAEAISTGGRSAETWFSADQAGGKGRKGRKGPSDGCLISDTSLFSEGKPEIEEVTI